MGLRTGARRCKPVTVDLESNFELIAPPGSGKGASMEIPNLFLGLRDSRSLSIDPSGQNAAVCAEASRTAPENEGCASIRSGCMSSCIRTLQASGAIRSPISTRTRRCSFRNAKPSAMRYQDRE